MKTSSSATPLDCHLKNSTQNPGGSCIFLVLQLCCLKIEPDHPCSPQTWSAALSHTFHSYSLGTGVLTSLGSYNRYNHDYYRSVCHPIHPPPSCSVSFTLSWCHCRDCLLLMGLHIATSILMCLALSSMTGFLASNLNESLGDVMTGGGFMFFLLLF